MDGALNEQIVQSVAQLETLLQQARSAGGSAAQAWAVQAIGMAMLNVVNQQQQLYVLGNAVTTAAVRAMLDKDPREAMALMREYAGQLPLTETLAQLKTLLDSAMAEAPASPAPSP